MPHVKKERYIKEYDLPEYDASILTLSKDTANYFEQAAKLCGSPKAVSNWIMGDFAKMLNEAEITISESKVKAEGLAKLITLIEKGTISSKIAKTVFEEMFNSGDDPESIVKNKGLVQISDEGEIRKCVEDILKNNPQSIADYKAGKDRALGYLVGQVMKASKGKANPGIVNKLLIEMLNK